MDLFRIELSPAAAQAFRSTPLLDRQFVGDLLEDLRTGRFPEADYVEPGTEPDTVAVVLVRAMAVAYVVDLPGLVVRVVWIRHADEG